MYIGFSFRPFDYKPVRDPANITTGQRICYKKISPHLLSGHSYRITSTAG